MYGQLDYKPENVQAQWTVSYFLCRDLAPPNLTPAQAGARGLALKQIKTEVADLTDAQLSSLNAIARGLPADTVDLVSDLYIALAHLRLPEVQRKAREARIESTLDGHFKGTKTSPTLTTGMQHVQRLAQLTPDAFLELMVRSQAARLQMVSMGDPLWSAQCEYLMDHLEKLANEMGIEPESPDLTLLISACFTRTWADRQGFLDLLALAAQKHLVGALSSTRVALVNSGHLVASEGDILVSVLQDCLAAELDGSMQAAIDQVVANQVALGRVADETRTAAVIDATIDAMDAGVNLGTQVQQKNISAIAAANQVRFLKILRMTPQRLRLYKKLMQAPTPAKGGAPSNPPDLDPINAWSVNRLLRWIEGPISEGAPQRLDRKAIVAAEKATRQDARVKTKMTDKLARNDLDLTEADVGLAVQNALCTTADFFIGDIQDMLFRAKVLDNASAAAQACTDLLAPLQKLKVDPDFDDQKARVVLHQAEMAIDVLRKDIHVKETDARTRQRFAQQLQTALSMESMVEGKRHGGVINCPLHRADWPWVAERYHRRWLPWIGQIAIDGVPQPLQRDQALGLYVTGKSLSGYEFDVSVHLWQRKPGRHSAPSTSLAPYAPMNTEDWIDTLIPCTVLHVPSAE